jgi:head-tail adaptor
MLATKRRRNDYEFENNIGRMDRLVYIMEPNISNGASNEDKIDSYDILRQVWASVENSTGDTLVEQNQTTHIQQSVFTMRYAPDVTIKHKIVHNNKMYSVLSAIEAGEHRKRFTKITGEYFKDYVIT